MRLEDDDAVQSHPWVHPARPPAMIKMHLIFRPVDPARPEQDVLVEQDADRLAGDQVARNEGAPRPRDPVEEVKDGDSSFDDH